MVSSAAAWARDEADNGDPEGYYRSGKEYRERYITDALKGVFGGI